MTNRIFLVDDDPYWTAILSKILVDLGFRNLTSFTNGTDCVQSLHLNPSVIFLDYQMKGIDGLEVLRQVKDYYPGIQVVFCTALEDLSVAVTAIAQGSQEYLLKSNADQNEVADILAKVMQNLPHSIA